MNYSNVFSRTQRQFDMTMNREKISVADYYNPSVKYDVFFRRNNRSTTPQGKVRFFYAQSTPIGIGTIFVLNGENYIVTSQDGIESDIQICTQCTSKMKGLPYSAAPSILFKCSFNTIFIY